MNIVQVVADGRPGGGTAVVLDLLAACREAGAETHLVTDRGSYAAGAARQGGTLAHELPFFSRLAGPTLSRDLGRLLERLGPDIVHLHGSRAAFVAGPLARRFPATAFHYTVHGYHFEHRLAPRRWLGRVAERLATRDLRSWVHVCRYDRDLAHARGLVPARARAQVIYNGVDAKVSPRDESDRDGVVSVGRLIRQKDPLLALEVLGRLAERGIATGMIGGGELEGRVRRLAARQSAAASTRLVGALSRAQAQAELARGQVLILPSRWEGLPIVLLEAMALGVAVVAAPVGGVPELIEHETTGLLVPSRSPAAWVEAVLRLLEDGELRRALVESARGRVREQFAWQRCLTAYFELYGWPAGTPQRTSQKTP